MTHIRKTFTGDGHWDGLKSVGSMGFVCGYCSHEVSSNSGWYTGEPGRFSYIRICPHCNAPTFFSQPLGKRFPSARPGHYVESLPDDIGALYEEARASAAGGAFTGAVMLCRKILMHVAVEKEAPENKSFLSYVEWLVQERYVPRGAEIWVDYIRKRGNDANHEIQIMTEEDAIGIITFTEALLRSVYELPSSVPFTQLT